MFRLSRPSHVQMLATIYYLVVSGNVNVDVSQPNVSQMRVEVTVRVCNRSKSNVGKNRLIATTGDVLIDVTTVSIA